MGTSPVNFCCWKLEKDHPHAYGDKIRRFLLELKHIGSSPRVWGQEMFNGGEYTKDGIIPTRMGTSALSILLTISFKDHPHAYGDKKFLNY